MTTRTQPNSLAPTPYGVEGRLRQMLDSARDTVIVSTDLDGRVTSWNEGARRIIGYSEAEMLGQPVDRFFVPEDRASGRMRAEMADALNHGSGEHEGWRVRKSGEWFWASGQMSPLRDETGDVIGYVKIVRDRTLERQAAEALAASQEQLRIAHTAGGIGSFAVDVATNVMTVSPLFCRMFGLPETATIDPADAERLILPEDRHAASTIQTRADGSAPLKVQYRIRHGGNGELRWISRGAELFRGADGAVIAMMGVAQDITERMLAEQALLESEAQFRGFAESIPNQVWTAPGNGQLDWFNQRVHEYSGLSFNELAGENWARIVHPEDRPRAGAAWGKSLQSGALYETEFRIRRADGVYRWHLARAVPIQGESGVTRWVGTNTDIQDQKEAMAVLSRSNETLESEVARRTADRDRMWRLSSDVMLVADFAGVVTAVNPAWTRLFGWSERKLLGSNFLDLVHPDDLETTLAEVARLTDGRATLRFENRYRTTDGSYRPLSWTAVPEGGFIHAVGRDMTAEKAAAADLESAQEALRQAQKMEAVGQLTGGIAHDFNNLLTGVIGSLDMLQRRIAQGRPVDVQRYVAAAITSANRAAALTHRLLAFSRRQPLDPRPVEVGRLVSGMDELLQRSVGEAVRLTVAAVPGLWWTRCDPHQLENAILNLVINARDAMPGGGAMTIELSNAELDEAYAARNQEVKPGQYVCIAVTDNGTGMTEDVVAKAFEPFFTTKPIGEGTGLGLSMIYGFIRQSEGHARIDSEPGRGTSVTLYLPRRQAPQADQQPEPQDGDVHAAGQGEVVLVVEDEPAVRSLVVEVLEELGYRAIEAKDGPAALQLLQSDMRIDLLVSDVGLPGLNGRQVADAARRTRPELRTLFMTGYAENAAVSGGFLAPGMELITKPFTLSVLAQRISAMMDDVRRGGPPV